MALFSLSRPKLFSYQNAPDPVLRRIWHLMEEQHKTLITIIFCNMLVNSLVSMLNESLLQKFELSPTATLIISAFTGIVILLLFGEITPMTIAYIYCEPWAKFCASPLYYAKKTLSPLTSVVEKICDRIQNLLGRAIPESLKPAEYLSYIEVCTERGVFTPEEAKLMRETFALRNKTVESVMRNRAGLCYVTYKDSPDDIRKMIREHAQAYLPISRELRLDSADAILSSRLFFAMNKESRKDWRHSACVLDQTIFIPEKTTLEKALRTMKRAGVYAALAADEYGAVSGVITREDIYSELTGSSVELDEQKDCEVDRVDDNCCIFSGMATLTFVNTTLQLSIPQDRFDATTLNGIFCELSGEIPKRGACVSFDNIELYAEEVSGNRLLKIRVRKVVQI